MTIEIIMMIGGAVLLVGAIVLALYLINKADKKN